MSLYSYFLSKEYKANFIPRACMARFLDILDENGLNDFRDYIKNRSKILKEPDDFIITRMHNKEFCEHMISYRKKEDDSHTADRLIDCFLSLFKEHEDLSYQEVNTDAYIVRESPKGKSLVTFTQNYINLSRDILPINPQENLGSRTVRCDFTKISKKIVDIRQTI